MSNICLINPPCLGAKGHAIFPMALVALATYLREHRIAVDLIDLDLEKKWPQEFLEADIFAIWSDPATTLSSFQVAQEIRDQRPSAWILFAGPYPSAYPEKALDSCPSVDLIVVGEAERTFLELLTGDRRISSLRQTPGIVFRDGAKITRTSSRPLIRDLDTLPFPDFSLVRLSECLKRDPAMPLVEIARPSEHRYRVKSPKRVFAEMQALLKQFGLLDFSLVHGNFTASSRYAMEFCDFFAGHNQERFTWTVTVNSEDLDQGQLPFLKKAGCRGLVLKIDRRSLNSQAYRACMKEAAAMGFRVQTSLVLEQEEDFDETVCLALFSKLAGSRSVRFERAVSEDLLFFTELINRMAPILRRLMDATRWSPRELFQRWAEWKSWRHPEKALTGPFIFNTFAEFSREGLRSSEKPRLALVSRNAGKPLIFLGPSLPRETAAAILDADYRHPIRRGDLPAAIRDGYRTIGIIDGVFFQDITVSLLEIRQAIAAGATIYGASSMGALRAAEAYPLGVIGVGEIYSWYRSEKVTSDDEVALCFDAATQKALSEPMVNIRATLDQALREKVISDEQKELITGEAVKMPFPERNYANLCRMLEKRISQEDLERIRDFFFGQAVDLKAEDAVALLRRIGEDYAGTDSSQGLSDRVAAAR